MGVRISRNSDGAEAQVIGQKGGRNIADEAEQREMESRRGL